jgi:hypothetical protein
MKRRFGPFRVLEDIWTQIDTGPTKRDERDFLRALHDRGNLQKIASEVLRNGIVRRKHTLTSIWVDAHPYAWSGGASPLWDSPKCELADLLVIIWDTHLKSEGRAIFVQGKMAKYPQHIESGKSTNIQRVFMETAPPFALSTSSEHLTPLTNNLATSEFHLHNLANRAGFLFQQFSYLQIRSSKRARRWPNGVAPFIALWPSTESKGVSYAEFLAHLANCDCAGTNFSIAKRATDWDNLIYELIRHTLGRFAGHAQGPNISTAYADMGNDVGNVGYLPLLETETLDFPVDDGARVPPESGIPILFFTPYRPVG